MSQIFPCNPHTYIILFPYSQSTFMRELPSSLSIGIILFILYVYTILLLYDILHCYTYYIGKLNLGVLPDLP